MRTEKLLLGGMLVALAGCTNPEARLPTTDEVATYQQLALQVEDAATSYLAAMDSPSTDTVAECQALHDAYDAEVRPWVTQLVDMSDTMDHYMQSHDGGSVADHGCTSTTMMYELDRHLATACASSDPAANRTEAAHHVDAMHAYGEHLSDRCEQIMSGADSGDWAWGPALSGCEEWDGCCSGAIHDGCCGDPGGMMGGMHHGCCDE